MDDGIRSVSISPKTKLNSGPREESKSSAVAVDRGRQLPAAQNPRLRMVGAARQQPRLRTDAAGAKPLRPTVGASGARPPSKRRVSTTGRRPRKTFDALAGACRFGRAPLPRLAGVLVHPHAIVDRCPGPVIFGSLELHQMRLRSARSPALGLAACLRLPHPRPLVQRSFAPAAVD